MNSFRTSIALFACLAAGTVSAQTNSSPHYFNGGGGWIIGSDVFVWIGYADPNTKVKEVEDAGRAAGLSGIAVGIGMNVFQLRTGGVRVNLTEHNGAASSLTVSHVRNF